MTDRRGPDNRTQEARGATKGGRAVLAAALVVGAGLVPAAAFAGKLDVAPAAETQQAKPVSLGNDDGLWRLGGVGASGTRGMNAKLSDKVLEEAGDPAKLAVAAGPLAQLPSGPLGIPGVALEAYKHAATELASLEKGCNLPWSLVAAIGRIESGHARGGQVDTHGNGLAPILGPVLDGTNGTADIADTDGGRLDGDPVHDRAVGPMQFIPSTWQRYAADGNGDGKADPNNIYDASVATGKLLCSSGANLGDPQARAAAVFGYNHSDDYVRNVLIWSAAYASGVRPTAIAPSVAGLPPVPAPNPQPPAPQPPAPQPPAPQPPAAQPPASQPTQPPSSPPPGSQPPSSQPSTPPSTPPTSPAPSCPPLPTPEPSQPTQPPSTPPTTTTPPPSIPPGCPVPTPTPSPTPQPSAPSGSSLSEAPAPATPAIQP
ncbi:lytic transglycosylase domain-containing protein [Sciscionella sediminilitoris]|uniref:lytic transglycosylase domain-containing protein n=1 Tax=Sciscionella sediminilitoris TaxID=1445613 RepID=UPI0018D13E2E|nr:lytic murein transglycosylase [Sciscionella sp. SE31]